MAKAWNMEKIKKIVILVSTVNITTERQLEINHEPLIASRVDDPVEYDTTYICRSEHVCVQWLGWNWLGVVSRMRVK